MKLIQENGRGKSDIPMITGIIGFVATIPGILCATVCGACASMCQSISTGESTGAGEFWILVNILSSAAGMVFGILSKSNPKISGAIMVGIAILTLILSFVTLNWFWGLIAVACFAIGGAISLTQETFNA